MIFSGGVRGLLAKAGLIPFLILLALVLFGSLEPRYLSYQNLFNVFRQSSFLMIVSIGQMVVLLTAGLDLSVGSIIALVSVVTALTMSATAGYGPILQMVAGIGAGLGTGILAGAINGLGVAVLRVNPFMMTLGMLSICFGLALTFSGGTPIYGLPPSFEDIFAYSSPLGIPSPVYFALGCVIAAYVYLTKTRPGRYIYAIGSNARAAELSGIRVRRHLTIVYMFSGLLAAIAGILLTARVGTGEFNMGQSMVLEFDFGLRHCRRVAVRWRRARRECRDERVFHQHVDQRDEPRRHPELLAAGRTWSCAYSRDRDRPDATTVLRWQTRLNRQTVVGALRFRG